VRKRIGQPDQIERRIASRRCISACGKRRRQSREQRGGSNLFRYPSFGPVIAQR
jgi:hypothetical protein